MVNSSYLSSVLDSLGIRFNEWFRIREFDGRSNVTPYKFVNDPNSTDLIVPKYTGEKYFNPMGLEQYAVLGKLITGDFTVETCKLTDSEYHLLKAYKDKYIYAVRDINKPNTVKLFSTEDDPNSIEISGFSFDKLTEDVAEAPSIESLLENYERF